MRLDSFRGQLAWNRLSWSGVAAESGRAASPLRRGWLSLAASVVVLFGYGCAQSAAAQAINLGPQVKGVLPVSNGGFGLDTQGLTGCPAENNGVWTVSAANCATAGNGVSAIDGPSGTTTGTVYLTGSAVSQSGSTFTITNSGGTLTNFNTGTWPSWLTPAVANATTTPTLGVTASSIPNGALAGPLVNEVTGPSSAVNGNITLAGPGVSQSGNTFTFNGNCAGGACVMANSTGSQAITQSNSSFGVSVNNNTTTLATPLTNLGLNLYSSGPGYYNNSGPWGGHSAIDMRFLNNSPGIDQGISANFTDLKTGDAAWQYAYLLYYGGAYFGSDEGLQAINIKPQQVGYFQGNLSTPSAGGLYDEYGPSASGITQLLNMPNGANTFSGPGVLESVSLPFAVGAATAQTAYIVVWSPGPGAYPPSTGTIKYVLPVTLVAGTGTQTFTSTNFGTVNIDAGDSLGIYIPTGNGISDTSYGGLCSTASGIPVVGAITTTTTCPNSSAIMMEGSLAAPTTGSITLAATNFACYSHAQGCSGQAGWEWATGGILLDMQNASPTTTTFTSETTVLGDSITMNLGNTPVTESTAWGTVSSCSPNPNNENNQVSQSDTCQITLGTSPASPGNFVAGEDACIAGPYQEEVPISSVGTTSSGVQAITFNTYHNWTWGTIMQGGPCGQFVVNNTTLAGGNNFWPVGYQVLGATTTSQILLANCVTGGCLGGGTTPTPQLLYAGLQNNWAVGLTRTSNVVSVNFSGSFNAIYNYPVGSTITVAGCTTDTDLNGSFAVTVNSGDGMNPVLSWAQTGSNEGPDTTCSINTGYPTFTFYPGAFINASSGPNGIDVQPNQVPWVSGDLIRESPASTYSENDIVVTHGQSSMPYNGESQLTLQDLGPSFVNNNISVTNGGAGTSGNGGTMFYANGSWQNYFQLVNAPAKNGCILCVNNGNPGTGSYAPPYYLFYGFGSDWILNDTHNGYFQFGNNVAIGGQLRAPAIGFYGGSAPDTTNPMVTLMGTTTLQANLGGALPGTSLVNLYATGSQVGLGIGSGSTWEGVFTAANATGQLNFPLTPTVNSTPLVVANDSTLAVASGTLAANSCTTAASVTISGVTTSGAGSHLSSGYTSDPASLTGWGAVGGMTFHIWPSAANTAEWEVCNQTNSSLTYSGITFSIGVE